MGIKNEVQIPIKTHKLASLWGGGGLCVLWVAQITCMLPVLYPSENWPKSKEMEISALSPTKNYEIYYVRDSFYQYMQFNCSREDDTSYYTTTSTYANGSNITDGTSFQNTFGSDFSYEGPQTGGSYVIRSDLHGNNWQFFQNYHLIL